MDVLFACLTGRHHNPEPVPYLAETASSFPVETAGHTGRNSRESDAMFELEMASDNQRTELYRYQSGWLYDNLCFLRGIIIHFEKMEKSAV